MALSAFDDKQAPPTDAALAEVLGKSLPLWRDLQQRVAAQCDVHSEWGWSGKAYGWGLRLRQPQRVVLYMTPCQGSFLASMALGEKASKAAHEEGLPARVLEIIDTAKKYQEGRAVRLTVKSRRDVGDVERLVQLRLQY